MTLLTPLVTIRLEGVKYVHTDYFIIEELRQPDVFQKSILLVDQMVDFIRVILMRMSEFYLRTDEQTDEHRRWRK